MDPATDLGRIIEINTKTGVSRHFATGMRNPQGLTIAGDGRIWATDHGPQGGDEVNLIVEGQNYGWPIVTYGMAYGFPPKGWPLNPTPGAHDKYTRPRLSFVPSVGIGSIVAADNREFPNWAASLIACSLKANTLFVLRTEGDEIAYSEPIALTGYRLRDIISLSNGRLAILTDRGSLLLVRNGELHRGDAEQFEVAGLSSLPDPSMDEAPALTATNATKRGRQYFIAMCARCHSVDGEVGIAPPLNGVVGRQIAIVSKFGYSPALARRKDRWSESLITSYVNNPEGTVPGTSMGATGIYEEQAKDLVEYLKTTR
jgi:cytochrome c2